MRPRVPMTPVDAAWLGMDSPANPMVITAMLRFDEPLEPAALDATLERLLGHARFRQRVVRDRRALTGAAWEEDPSFERAYHVRHATAPAPGDDRALEALVGAAMSAPLDKRRPLWRLEVVDGLARGAALIVRVHHAVGDGVALVRLLLDVTAAGAAEAPVEVGIPRAPRPRGLAARLARSAEQARTLGRLLALPFDPDSPLRGALGTDKLAAFSRPYPLETVRRLARAHGGHVNDLLVAAVAGALRRSDRAPRAVRAMIPVFLRGRGADEGNHFGLVYLPLPVAEGARGARVRAVREAMNGIKAAPDATVAFTVLAAMGFLSASIERLGVELFTRKASLLVTNVPGPAARVRVAGREVASLYVWAPTSGSIGAGFSLLTYAGELRLGVAADANLGVAPAGLVRAFEEELDALAREAHGGGEPAT